MSGITKQTVNLIQLRRRETAETCPKHPDCHLVYIKGLDKVKPFCEQCQHEQIQVQDQQMQKNVIIRRYRGFLRDASLVDRADAFNYTFDNFWGEADEKGNATPEQTVKHNAGPIAAFYYKFPDKNGNSLLYGNAGAGKTHLAMAILNAINDRSNPMQKCLFLSVNKLMREMKYWFSDNTGIWSPRHVTDIVHEADVVVLDDLGAESANNMASSFVQDAIFDIYESNQRVITTTNLGMDELYQTYHERVVSRMQEGYMSRVIDFTKIADKRSRI